jgi:hypothetical protein
MAKINKKGRNSEEHYTVLVRHMMMCPASAVGGLDAGVWIAIYRAHTHALAPKATLLTL